MLEWLKTILGDHYTEDIDKQISTEIGKGFVARADFNAKNDDLKTANTRPAPSTSRSPTARRKTAKPHALCLIWTL